MKRTLFPLLLCSLTLTAPSYSKEIILCRYNGNAHPTPGCPEEYSKGSQVCIDYDNSRFYISTGSIKLKALNKSNDPEDIEYSYYLKKETSVERKRSKHEYCWYTKSTYLKSSKGQFVMPHFNNKRVEPGTTLKAGKYQFRFNEKLFKFSIQKSGLVSKIIWDQQTSIFPGNYTEVHAVADFNLDGKPDLFITEMDLKRNNYFKKIIFTN